MACALLCTLALLATVAFVTAEDVTTAFYKTINPEHHEAHKERAGVCPTSSTCESVILPWMSNFATCAPGVACGTQGGLCGGGIDPSTQDPTCQIQSSAVWCSYPFFSPDGQLYGGAPAGMCVDVFCPTNGIIHIKASTGRATWDSPGACGAHDMLYLTTQPFSDFGDSYPSGWLAPPVPGYENVQSIDYKATCIIGQSFSICENEGVIMTQSLFAEFTAFNTINTADRTYYGFRQADRQAGNASPPRGRFVRKEQVTATTPLKKIP